MNFSRIPPSLRSRLSLRLVIFAMACSLFFTLLASAIQLYFSFQSEVSRLKWNYVFIEENYLPFISQSAFNIDEEQIRLQIRALIKLPDIEYIEIRDFDKKLWIVAGNPNFVKDFEVTYPITNIDFSGKEVLLGHIRIVSSYQGIYRRLYQSGLIILMTTMIQIFPTAFCIIIIIHFIFIRHLVKIAEYSSSLDTNSLDSVLKLNRSDSAFRKKDELSQVVLAINDLTKRLDEDIKKRELIYSELRNSQKQLYEEKQFTDNLIESLPSVFFVFEDNIRLVRWNSKLNKTTGFSDERLLGMQPYEFFNKKDKVTVRNIIEKATSEGATSEEVYTKQIDRSNTTFLFSVVSIIRDGKNYIVGTGIDITDQRRAAKELQIIKYSVDNSIDSAYRVREDGSISYANYAASKLTGYALKELIGLHYGIIDPYFAESDFDTRWQMLQDAKIHSFESTNLTINGSEIPVTVSVSFTEFEDEAYLYIGVQDISERKKHDAERMRMASVIEQSHDNIVITDLEGKIEYVNPAFEKSTGYSRLEVLGKKPNVLKSGKHSVSFYSNLWKTITSSNVWTGTFINRQKNGELIKESAIVFPVLNTDGTITNFAAVKRDITEQAELEEQFRQTQKMDAIGTLAGGIAHDFNNILSGVFAYTQLAQKKIPESAEFEKVGEYLSRILSAGFRAKDLVDQILTFSRKAEYEPKSLSLQPLVKELIKFLRASLPSNIEIESHIEPDLRNVYGDYTQIYQVLMNLCTNASHAMEDMQGKLMIALTNHPIATKSPETCNLDSGEYVLISVEDTGSGMDEITRQRIFEPFYTTKQKGKGTGLGLAVVHGIVVKHGGGIHVYSAPGVGTKFNIYLPVSFDDAVSEERLVQGSLPTGIESILILDDEEELLFAYGDMLELYGYNVSKFSDSRTALNDISINKNKYQLVISDYTMPAMNGVELSKEIYKLNKNLPVIIISGLAESVEIKAGNTHRIERKLSKPIIENTLIDTVRDVLDKNT